MTVMAERHTNLDRRLAELRDRCCAGKATLSHKAARSIVVFSRGPEQDPTVGPLEAYRCPFADEHADPGLEWHVGHAMSMFRLQETARLLRARSGNAPGPVSPESGDRIGRNGRHVPKRRKGHR